MTGVSFDLTDLDDEAAIALEETRWRGRLQRPEGVITVTVRAVDSLGFGPNSWRSQRADAWPRWLVIGGVAFIVAAAVGHPKLGMLAIYAATGGIEFVIQAWLLARRRRRLASAAPVPSAG